MKFEYNILYENISDEFDKNMVQPKSRSKQDFNFFAFNKQCYLSDTITKVSHLLGR